MSLNISLYRKYRPKSFDQIHGQEFVVKTLKNSIINNKLSHAYIFSGPRGIGKTSIAKIFAKAVNCTNNNDGDCCNKCEQCNFINSNSSMDIVEIDAASNNGVNDVRLLIENISYLPTNVKYKVYIIDESHMLTNGAWNALLKTIEDPPKHLIFIFATTEPYKIPPTIISRCQKFNLSNLSIYELETIIKKVCEYENIQIEADATKKIAHLADGSVRDCLTLLGQIDTYTNSNIDVSSINTIFGLLDVQTKIDFINHIVECKFEKIINAVNDYELKGIDFYQLGIDIVEILFDKLIYLKTNDDSLLKVLSKVNLNSFDVDIKSLINLIETWQDGLFKMKNYSNPKFYFELTCLSSTKIFDYSFTINTNVVNNNLNNVENIDTIEIKKENKQENWKPIESLSKEKNEINSKQNNKSFNNVLIDDIVVKKTVGSSIKNNNINYVELTDNKKENNSLKKLDIATENILDKEKNNLVEDNINANPININEIDKNINSITTPIENDISAIIKSAITTKPFVVNNKKNNDKKQKENKAKKIIDSDDVYNLFTLDYDDEIQNELETFEKNIEDSIINNPTKVDNSRQKIIDDFKDNLKSIATNTTSIKMIDKNHQQQNKQEDNIDNNLTIETKNNNDDNNQNKNTVDIDNKENSLNNIVINEYNSQQKREIFFRIADNKNDDLKNKIVNIFNNIKGKIAMSLEEGYIVNANKILLASNYGVIILFDDEIACRNLNVNANDSNFLKYIKDKFDGIYLFLALTKEVAQEYANQYKMHIKTNNKLDDVNISHLLDKINKKESLKDLAIDMLGDLIEEEE